MNWHKTNKNQLFACPKFTDVFHWSCLNERESALPSHTAPGGHTCPTCYDQIFPSSNLISPVADVLRARLKKTSWGRDEFGAILVLIHYISIRNARNSNFSKQILDIFRNRIQYFLMIKNQINCNRQIPILIPPSKICRPKIMHHRRIIRTNRHQFMNHLKTIPLISIQLLHTIKVSQAMMWSII